MPKQIATMATTFWETKDAQSIFEQKKTMYWKQKDLWQSSFQKENPWFDKVSKHPIYANRYFQRQIEYTIIYPWMMWSSACVAER
jgi:hypothetical protein